MTPREALDALDDLNKRHRQSAVEGYCTCGWAQDDCTYFLMLSLMDIVLSDHVKNQMPTRQITEYGYIYNGSPRWSSADSITGGWGYTEALRQQEGARLWEVPDLVGPVIERTVDCYDRVPHEWREVSFK